MTPLLQGKTIIDFSHRLPGPLAGKVLSDMGAKVIKIEDKTFGDPFVNGAFSHFDESFIDWYEELNENKQIIKLDFKAPETSNIIKEYLDNSHGLIQGLPLKLQTKFNLTSDELKKIHRPFAVIEMAASRDHHQAMHDVNALALCGLLQLHISESNQKRIDPPFLPLSGIMFGVKIATDLLGAYIQSLETQKAVVSTSYLLESTHKTLAPFWPKKQRQKNATKFLHNGKFPCYSIYQTSDRHYIALAAVEEKFWANFCQCFNLSIPPEKRFHSFDNEVFSQLENCFQSLSLEQILKKSQDHEICLTPILSDSVVS